MVGSCAWESSISLIRVVRQVCMCAKLFKNIQENYAERVGRANSLARLINVELKSRLTKMLKLNGQDFAFVDYSC